MICQSATEFSFLALQPSDMVGTGMQNSVKINAIITPYSQLSILNENKYVYSRTDIEVADRAIRHQGLLGRP